MSEISESEIKSMTKEQNYIRGYEDGKSDMLSKIRAEIEKIPTPLIATGYTVKSKALGIIDIYKTESEEV